MLRIGRHIQTTRIECGLTEKQLADGFCSVAMIRDIEAGRRFATLDLLQNIAERLNTPLQRLLSAPRQTEPSQLFVNSPEDHVMNTYRHILSMIEKIEEFDEIPAKEWYAFQLNKADALIHTNQSDRAITLLEQVIQRAEADAALEQNQLAIIHQKMGLAYYHAPNMLESYTHYMRAYMISAHLNEYSPLTSRITMDLARVGEALGGTKQLAEQLFQLGMQSQEANDLSRACTYLEQANALYKAHNMVAMGHEMKLAYEALLRTQRNPEHAVQELMFTAKRLEKAGDLPQLANTYAQKADLHLNLAQTEEAGRDLLLAEALVTEEMAATDPRLTLVYHVRSRYHLLTGDYEQAVRFGETAARYYAAMEFHQQATESLQLVAVAYREHGMEEAAHAVEARIEELMPAKLT